MNRNSNDPSFTIVQSLDPFMITLTIIGAIALAVYITYIIRLWQVQTATLQMQKDVEEIKNHLLGAKRELATTQTSDSEVYISDEEKRVLLADGPSKFTTSRAFVWLAVTIPVLIIILGIVVGVS